MPTKLKNFCEYFNENKGHLSELDNVALHIFNHHEIDKFVYSSDDSTNSKYPLNIKNNFLEDFSKFGPNEKNIINKLFNPSIPLIFLSGGIGVGKTTFSLFFKNEVMKMVSHADKKHLHKSPSIIYFNFLEIGEYGFDERDLKVSRENFCELLANELETEINQKEFFGIEEEIIEIWHWLISKCKNEGYKNPAVSFIINSLRDNKIGVDVFNEIKNENGPRNSLLANRKKIRENIRSDPWLKLNYYKALFLFIKEKFFIDHPFCLLIIIDNIDREHPVIQREVEFVIRSFVWNSSLTILMNVRQSTFAQGHHDNYSQVIDKIEYNGPTPLQIIFSRIESFLGKNKAYENCKSYFNETEFNFLVKGIEDIYQNFLRNDKNDRISGFFKSLCGRSVRKGLILSQRLVNNKIYNPIEIGRLGSSSANLKPSDIIHALMIGKEEIFTYNEKE